MRRYLVLTGSLALGLLLARVPGARAADLAYEGSSTIGERLLPDPGAEAAR